MLPSSLFVTHFALFFFFNDTATTEIYTLSLHDALPIFAAAGAERRRHRFDRLRSHYRRLLRRFGDYRAGGREDRRSEEHTSELQSRGHLVCRLLLEKKKKNINNIDIIGEVTPN